jgi:hypothetical protein
MSSLLLLVALACRKDPAAPEARDGYAVGEDCDDGDAAVHGTRRS